MMIQVVFLIFTLYAIVTVLIYGQAKIPDIEKCLEVVSTLEARKGTGEVRCLIFATI